MNVNPGASSSANFLVAPGNRALDWALASGFLHDRPSANAGCGARPDADTDRRSSGRLNRRPTPSGSRPEPPRSPDHANAEEGCGLCPRRFLTPPPTPGERSAIMDCPICVAS